MTDDNLALCTLLSESSNVDDTIQQSTLISRLASSSPSSDHVKSTAPLLSTPLVTDIPVTHSTPQHINRENNEEEEVPAEAEEDNGETIFDVKEESTIVPSVADDALQTPVTEKGNDRSSILLCSFVS